MWLQVNNCLPRQQLFFKDVHRGTCRGEEDEQEHDRTWEKSWETKALTELTLTQSMNKTPSVTLLLAFTASDKIGSSESIMIEDEGEWMNEWKEHKFALLRECNAMTALDYV